MTNEMIYLGLYGVGALVLLGLYIIGRSRTVKPAQKAMAKPLIKHLPGGIFIELLYLYDFLCKTEQPDPRRERMNESIVYLKQFGFKKGLSSRLGELYDFSEPINPVLERTILNLAVCLRKFLGGIHDEKKLTSIHDDFEMAVGRLIDEINQLHRNPGQDCIEEKVIVCLRRIYFSVYGNEEFDEATCSNFRREFALSSRKVTDMKVVGKYVNRLKHWAQTPDQLRKLKREYVMPLMTTKNVFSHIMNAGEVVPAWTMTAEKIAKCTVDENKYCDICPLGLEFVAKVSEKSEPGDVDKYSEKWGGDFSTGFSSRTRASGDRGATEGG